MPKNYDLPAGGTFVNRSRSSTTQYPDARVQLSTPIRQMEITASAVFNNIEAFTVAAQAIANLQGDQNA